MAETYKILGQEPARGLDPQYGANEARIVYEVPANTQSSVSSVSVINNSNSSGSYKLGVVKAADVATSTEDISLDVELPVSEDWFSITYGDDTFVAIAYYSDAAAYSTNGITWTQTTMPSSESWRSVTYGDGTFVAVTSYSDTAAYSTDGITWTQTTMPSSEAWSSVTYGDGTFVAVASNYYDTAAYSTNGITWTQTTMPSPDNWSSVTYGDANYQAIEYTQDQTIYTVPSNKEAVISSIFISNTSETSDTYNFAVVPDGETLSDIHNIRKNVVIAGKDFHQIETKITLSAGDSLVALSAATDKLNITAFGVEK